MTLFAKYLVWNRQYKRVLRSDVKHGRAEGKTSLGREKDEDSDSERISKDSQLFS